LEPGSGDGRELEFVFVLGDGVSDFLAAASLGLGPGLCGSFFEGVFQDVDAVLLGWGILVVEYEDVEDVGGGGDVAVLF